MPTSSKFQIYWKLYHENTSSHLCPQHFGSSPGVYQVLLTSCLFFYHQAVTSSLLLSFYRNSSLLSTLFCTLFTSWKAFCISVKNTFSSCFPPLSFWMSLRGISLYPWTSLDLTPGDSDGKESACNKGDSGSTPGSGRSPGEGNGNSLQHSCLENPTGSQRVRHAWATNTHNHF